MVLDRQPKNRPPSARRGLTITGVAAAVILCGVIAAGLWMTLDRPTAGPSAKAVDLQEVTRGGFDIIIPASGELTAKKQTEIVNKLESQAVITEIVEEGSFVHEGDVLVRFNDEQIRNELKDAEESVIGARNELESAQAELEIRKKSRESEVEKAQLAVEIAELDLKSWEKGEVVTKRQDLKLAQETAELNYNRLQQRFEASKRLYDKEFISLDEYKQDEIALVEAKAKLAQAQLDIEVYEDYEYVKQRKQKESDLLQAQKELARVQARQDAEVRRAEADEFGRQRRLDSREERLARHQEQLKLCTIVAPQDGLVVYASSLDGFRWMRERGQNLQVGTEVWRNQLIMILPDTSQMVAEVKINEALSGRIQPGQTATVTCDAAPDSVLAGTVESIGVLAETGGWRDPNRRDYTVRIRLDGRNTLDLKPSMRCQADIKVEHVDDAIHVPIQAVHREGAANYVYVPDGAGFSQRKVALGRASELYAEITEGLEPGERVLLRDPAAKEIVATLPPEETKPVADEDEKAENDQIANAAPPPPTGSPEAVALQRQQKGGAAGGGGEATATPPSE